MHTDLGARVQLLESLFNKIVQSNTTVLENPITQYAINCGRLLWPLYHLNSSVTSPSIGTQPNQFQRFSHFVFSLVALRQTIRVIRLKITCQATNKSKMAQLDIRCHQITLSFGSSLHQVRTDLGPIINVIIQSKKYHLVQYSIGNTTVRPHSTR